MSTFTGYGTKRSACQGSSRTYDINTGAHTDRDVTKPRYGHSDLPNLSALARTNYETRNRLNRQNNISLMASSYGDRNRGPSSYSRYLIQIGNRQFIEVATFTNTNARSHDRDNLEYKLRFLVITDRFIPGIGMAPFPMWFDANAINTSDARIAEIEGTAESTGHTHTPELESNMSNKEDLNAGLKSNAGRSSESNTEPAPTFYGDIGPQPDRGFGRGRNPGCSQNTETTGRNRIENEPCPGYGGFASYNELPNRFVNLSLQPGRGYGRGRPLPEPSNEREFRPVRRFGTETESTPTYDIDNGPGNAGPRVASSGNVGGGMAGNWLMSRGATEYGPSNPGRGRGRLHNDNDRQAYNPNNRGYGGAGTNENKRGRGRGYKRGQY